MNNIAHTYKTILSNNFERALASYDKEASVQKMIAERLAQMALPLLPTEPSTALEIGCGTGFLTQQIARLVPLKRLYLNDLVERAVVQTKEKTEALFPHSPIISLAGDAERIPFPAPLDLIFSGSTIQWFANHEGFFNKCHRHLSPHGLLLFNTFGPDHFKEIKELTGEGLAYPSADTLRNRLESCFPAVTILEKTETQRFDSPQEVLQHIKRTGVASNNNYRWTKEKLQRFYQQYEDKFSSNGKIPLTWHVYYVMAQKE